MKHLTPLKAIRAKCVDCSAGQPKEVRLCPVDICPIFILRFGKNPARRGIGNSKGVFGKETPTQAGIFQVKEL